MDIFSPIKTENDRLATGGLVSDGAPRCTTPSQPIVTSKLDHCIDREELENDLEVDVNELEKSPTRAKHTVPLPKFELVQHSTPVQLGKTRTLDVPSSLEKFKSLRIGIESLNQSMNSTKPSSPVQANPFSPKQETSSNQTAQTTVFRGIIEDALSEFKATIRNDIQNLHVEILKQSIAQQVKAFRIVCFLLL